jgi:hypothetical protein
MPNVLPVLNSNTPAMIWASPPYAKARGTTAAIPAGGKMPALTQLRTTVVKPKAANPSGPGLADFNVDGGNTISFSISAVRSCSLVSVAHPSYFPIGENNTKKRTYSRRFAAEHLPLFVAVAFLVVIPGGDLLFRLGPTQTDFTSN